MSGPELPPPTAPDDEFAQALARLGAQSCPVCGAHVTRLEVPPECPDCTAPLHVGLGSPDLRMRAWIVSILALALPLGFSIVGVIAFVGGTLAGASFSSGTGLVFLIFFVGFLVLTTALTLVIIRRRRFWRMSKERQTMFAKMLVGLGALTLVALWGALIMRKM